MHQVHRAWQQLSGRTGIRLLILVLLALLTFQFYTGVLSGQNNGVFIGMYHLSKDVGVPDLMVNAAAIGFMACGVAIPLEQMSEYLSVPDYYVYVRARRGIMHFVRYLALVIVYCLVFTGLQTVIAVMVLPSSYTARILVSSVCAAWTLLVLMLTANAGYLLGNRAIGYFVAALLYGLLLAVPNFTKWFAFATVGAVPAWVPVLAGATVLLVVGNAIVFNRYEIE